MARMQKWREGSRERAPPTPFIFEWCKRNGNTTKDPITVLAGRACEACVDAGWKGQSNRPSPSNSETSSGYDRYLSPGVRALPTPLTSIEDELDKDKMTLDFPMPGK